MAKPVIRCAVYTRKSSEEGLEQSFNSLHAQREACEAYVLSQRHEGWTIIPTSYDDGGFSGGNLERPALRALLADIQAGAVDVVVVYKIDRLTRSLLDFAKIVEIFDAKNASFVSVTQSFNTTTSMGRLTLNVLLSFAQFEREVTGERIRDKFAASKKKGMWMGGNVPLGYAVRDRKLVVVEEEAETVRTVFRIYANTGAVSKTKAELDRLGLKTKSHKLTSGERRGGLPFRVGHLYTILRNCLYRGQVHHKGQTFKGDHEAIIDQHLWDRVQAQLANNAVARRSGSVAKEPSLLAGLLLDGDGNRMTPSHAVKDGRRYRYYISNHLIAGKAGGRSGEKSGGLRIGAGEIEDSIASALATFFLDPQQVIAVFGEVKASPTDIAGWIDRGKSLSADLRTSGSPSRYATIRAIVERIQIGGDALRICLSRSELASRLGETTAYTLPDGPITLTLPVQLHRLGVEKRLVVTADAPRANPDPALIKAVVRAHSWFDAIKNRRVNSISELATREGLSRTYLGSLTPLALLAPDIVSAILDGRQPMQLTLDRLLANALPSDWAEQRAALGFSC